MTKEEKISKITLGKKSHQGRIISKNPKKKKKKRCHKKIPL